MGSRGGVGGSAGAAEGGDSGHCAVDSARGIASSRRREKPNQRPTGSRFATSSRIDSKREPILSGSEEVTDAGPDQVLTQAAIGRGFHVVQEFVFQEQANIVADVIVGTGHRLPGP